MRPYYTINSPRVKPIPYICQIAKTRYFDIIIGKAMNILPIIQIILSILLVGGILLQRSEAGLGSAFGASSLGEARYHRRGFEKTLFTLTIIIAVLFAASAFASLIVLR